MTPARWFQRRVPFYEQQNAVECGVACVRMVLAYHGRDVSQEEMRRACRAGRDGIDGPTLLRAAREFGLEASFGKRMTPGELADSPVPAILHWQFNHFVVLERLRPDGSADIVDPSIGRMKASPVDLARKFTGVALFFSPGPSFTAVRSSNPLLRYRRLLMQHRRLLATVFVISVLVQTLYALGAKATQVITDEIVPGHQSDLLSLLVLGMCVVAAVQAGVGLVRTRVLIFLRTQVDMEMGLQFFRHLVALPYSFFEQRAPGDLVMRLTSNGALRDLLCTRLAGTLLDAATLTLVTVVVLVVQPRLGLFVVLLMLLRLTVLLAVQARRRELLRELLVAQSGALSRAVEIVADILTIKATGSEERAVKRWESAFGRSLSVAFNVGLVQMRLEAIGTVLSTLSPLLVLALAAQQVVLERMSLGEMFAFSFLASLCFGTASSLASTWETWQEVARHVERIRDVLDHPLEQVAARCPAPTVSGAIRFSHVHFKYPGGRHAVLHDLCLDVAAGDFIAIVGPSGAGKSTLARLLLGIYSPTAGEVLFDGQPQALLELGSLRRQIGAVIQEARPFSGSLRLNIASGDPSIALKDVIEAARLAEIHDDIVRMPSAYETVISGGGTNLSGGQRQRIAIARALVSRPPILLFDEATSALDSGLEARIYGNVARLGMTRIVITHRLSAVAMATRIAVMSDGELAELGTHAELLARGGLYATMVERQSGGERGVH